MRATTPRRGRPRWAALIAVSLALCLGWLGARGADTPTDAPTDVPADTPKDSPTDTPTNAPAASPTTPATASPDAPTAPPTADAVAAEVERRLAELSPSERVGQLLMIGIEGTRMTPAARELLRELRPGGVSVFTRNVRGARQVAWLLRGIRTAFDGALLPFLAVDQEGGLVVRLRRGALVLPGAMVLGAADDPGLARRAGRVAGEDLRRLGFNMNLSPVLDVNSQAGNPVIGTRAFGDDPARVAALGLAFAEGLRAGGVIPVAKHFPGHGDTPTDSHGELPSLPHGLERLLSFELEPFAAAIRQRACPAVMTAHVALPALERDGALVPATLSHRVVTGLLRERLGFDGVVLTDDLGMGALSHLSIGSAAVQALQAGADLLLVSRGASGQRAVFRAVLRAVERGEISAARIDESVRRILALKVTAGLLTPRDPAARRAAIPASDPAGKEVVREIAERGVTLVLNREAALPLPTEGRLVVLSQSDAFLKALARLRPNGTGRKVPVRPSAELRQRLLEEVAGGPAPARIVVAATNRGGAALAAVLARTGRAPVVLVSLASPYLLSVAPDVGAAVAAYSFRWSACRAAAQVLAGQLEPGGALPVTVPGVAPRGTGLRLAPTAEAARGPAQN